MKKFLFSFVFLFVFFSSFSQCPTENVNLRSQSDIDHFKLNYPNCTEIYRDIIINGSNIGNLDSLNGIKKISRHLKIINTALSNFNGLDSLTHINGGLTIWDNDNLETLSGLETLVFIGEELEIKSSPILSTIQGLNNVKSIGSLNTLHNTTNGLSIKYSQVSSLQELSSLEYLSGLLLKNNQITSLEGLEGLLKLDGGISISFELISNLSGLNNVATISNDIYLGSNNELNSLQGFNKLNNVGGSFTILGNPKLDNLMGLESLTVIHEDSQGYNGSLIIEDAEITNLQGLTNLTTVDDLMIKGNPKLLNFEGLNSLQLIKNDLEVQRNDNLENLIGLENLQTIEGRLFVFQNIKMTSLNGLSGLLTIGDDLTVNDNILLPNLTGLSQINSVGKLELTYNSNLTSLKGIESLQSIPQSSIRFFSNEKLVDLTALSNASTGEGSLGWGDLYLSNNTSLLSLDGLENLGFSQGQYAIYFYNNTSLNDIDAMNNWDAERLNNLTMINNTSLSMCQVLPICSFLSKNDLNYVNVSGNMGSCSNAQDIKGLCNTNPDKDGDGVLNEEDNCPEKPNPNQEDVNNNGIGDVCEAQPLNSKLVQTKNISCFGDTDAEIAVEVTGGTAPYTYELYTSGNILISSGANNIYSNLSSGIYTVVVTDNDFNQVQSNGIVITEPTHLASAVLVTGMTCSNSNNARIAIEVTGGVPPYVYSIDGGVTFSSSNVFQNLQEGFYISEVRDSNGCSILQDFTINQIDPLASTISVTDEICYGNNDGSAIIEAEGGVAPYEYSIDGGVTFLSTNIFQNLEKGIYYSVIRDKNSCSVEQIFEINGAPQIIPEITTTIASCNTADGSISIAIDNQEEYLFNINDGVELSGFQESNEFKNLNSGSYSILILHTSGCQLQQTVIVENDSCSEFELPVNNFIIEITSETCAESNNGNILLKALENLSYTAVLTGDDKNETKEFRVFSNFQDLEAGSYNLCVRVEGEDNYEKCFNVEITEPEVLEVDAKTNTSDKTVSLKLKGSTNYFITVNGLEYNTSENQITLPLSKVKNSISVKTNLDCQGVFEDIIMSTNESVNIYPNPVDKGDVSVFLPFVQADESVQILLYSQRGVRVFEKTENVKSNVIKFNIDHLPAGIYSIFIASETQKSIRKVIKK